MEFPSSSVSVNYVFTARSYLYLLFGYLESGKNLGSVNRKAREVFLEVREQPPIARYFPGYVLSAYGQNKTPQEAFDLFREVSRRMSAEKRFALFFSLLRSSGLNLSSPWEVSLVSGEGKIPVELERNSLRDVGGVPLWLTAPSEDHFRVTHMHVLDGFNIATEDKRHQVCWPKRSGCQGDFMKDS
ncbi:MAG: hypothetical protein JSR80_03475 [Verrucomicrobia bacterium]|nr:hypothetical protein [Verrucomicrobiota bacterium]